MKAGRWVLQGPPSLLLCCLVTCLLMELVTCQSTPAKAPVRLGATVPYTAFKSRVRAYQSSLTKALNTFTKRSGFSFPSLLTIAPPNIVVRHHDPNPSDTLNTLCNSFLKSNVCAVIYISNSENYGSQTAATLYFLQLAGYLGIPVISFIADNAAMEQRHQSSLVLQLAPSIKHQCGAMLSILRRYNWNQFSAVTSQIPGNKDFELAIRESLMDLKHNFKFTLLTIVKVNTSDQETIRSALQALSEAETRVILLYCSQNEAAQIFKVARQLGLTGKDFVWIVTQTVVTDMAPRSRNDLLESFPIGLLAVSYNTTEENLPAELYKAIKVIGHGLELFVNDPTTTVGALQPNLSCTDRWDVRWNQGRTFFKHLRNVSVNMGSGTPNIEFNTDGSLKYAELNILNLDLNKAWNKIGTWSHDSLELQEIVWPGNSRFPPRGKPEQFHLHVTFLEEPPYVNRQPPDPKTEQCENNGVYCLVGREADVRGIDLVEARKNSSLYECCSGFCVDLLKKLSADIGFTFDFVRVEDGIWGSKVNGTWNGLIAALLNRKTDIVMTSLKINSQREEVVDFSVPFLETGIAVVVAKRTGIVSPTAFLEPFDTLSWVLILLVVTHIAGASIFLFEWFSPVGYDMKLSPPEDRQFSLFRAIWLVWAMLFGAAVDVDCPRGFTARWMSGIWALFAVVFLAIYTANLAAFMITGEEYPKLVGITDTMMINPFTQQPPFRFGTVQFGNTETIIKENFPDMYHYMKKYKRTNVTAGIASIKKDEMDAFVYDSTVLEYLATRDEECRLLTVGKWYARTGYGVAFRPKSKYTDMFNRQLLIYKETGVLDRMEKFWLSGACQRVGQAERSSSNPLGVMQFISAFLLLGGGIALSFLLLMLEHSYYKYLRSYVAKTNKAQCCNLISLNLAKSLTLQDVAQKAQNAVGVHACEDPMCDAYFQKMKIELRTAQQRIEELEKRSPESVHGNPRCKRRKSKPTLNCKGDKKTKVSKVKMRSGSPPVRRKSKSQQTIQVPAREVIVDPMEMETFI